MRSDLASDWSNGLESDWPSRSYQCVNWCATDRVGRIVSE
jgi:predicted NUDIX family NTP pyrophosphohydrolase